MCLVYAPLKNKKIPPNALRFSDFCDHDVLRNLRPNERKTK